MRYMYISDYMAYFICITRFILLRGAWCCVKSWNDYNGQNCCYCIMWWNPDGTNWITHSNHVISSKRVDTLICHTTMHRNSINFLYNLGHVTFRCLEVVPVVYARVPKYSTPLTCCWLVITQPPRGQPLKCTRVWQSMTGTDVIIQC